jgi:dienelactone hydrolase
MRHAGLQLMRLRAFSRLRALCIEETTMNNRVANGGRIARAAYVLLIGAMLAGAGASQAKDSELKNRFFAPEQAGPYGIGHTTAIVADPSRNLDGTSPATSAGRFLHLDIWYPTTVKTDQHIRYTWNNPLYNANSGGAAFPGLPDLPPMTAVGSTSFNPVTDDAPLARSRFPLLIASHGNLVSSAKNMPDTLETLASHGYVVASVEHTGNNDAWYQADFIKNYVPALQIGPNPRLGTTDVIAQRSRDVRFVIDAVLQGIVDQRTGMAFSRAVDADKIGVLGFSLGAQTSLATVTGIRSGGLPADRRVKAAFMGGGSNWGLLLKQADYANAEVPLLFFANDTGIAYNDFNQYTGSKPKYRVEVAGLAHHTAGYQSSWCQDFHNSMVTIKPGANALSFANPRVLEPSDIANFIFDATFYFTYTGSRQAGVYDYCDASVFDGISDAQLNSVFFGASDIVAVKNELMPLMPLKPEVSLTEITRLTNWYAVSFFNKTLKNDNSYTRYLTNSRANQRANPLVEFVANCEKQPDHPFDLLPGDKITFEPQGYEGYFVSVTPGQPLYDAGPTKLATGGDGSPYLSYPGFSFPVPGLAERISTLIVNEDGAITSRTASAIGGIDNNGSPWYTRGQLLLGNRFTVGALMKNLDSNAALPGGGVFGYLDTANDRVVVTYKDIPAVGTTAPNTLQVAIYRSGKIDIVIGELAPTGAVFSPRILGTIGVATGETKARHLDDVDPISFSAMRGYSPTFLRLDSRHAIYEQFQVGSSASCGRGHDDDHENGHGHHAKDDDGRDGDHRRRGR